MHAERSGDLQHPQVVTPPEGVILHDYAEHPAFGLSKMFHQSVDLNPGAGKSNPIDGTTLVYEPGFIRVDINRQGLPAEHINRIGELAIAVQDNLTMQRYLEEVSRWTERATTDIRFLSGYTGGMDIHTPMEEINAKAEGILQEGTGFSKAMLGERQRPLRERLAQMDEKAHAMGVVIFDRFGIWNHIVTQPEKTDAPEKLEK